MKALAVAVLCLAAAALPAQEGGLDIRGSVLDSTVLLHDAEAGSLGYAGFVRASLSVRNRDRENAKFDLDASASLLYGQYADAFLAPVRAAGLGTVPALNVPLELDVRKLSLSLYLGPVDLTVGRKIVNWGYGLVFSPADAYASVDLSDISLRRRGSDILMAEAYIGEAASAALILSPTSDMRGFKAGARVSAGFSGFNASLIGVYKDADSDLVAGAAFKGTVPLLDAGLTLEGVRHVLSWSAEGWFEAMAGLDYSFFDRTLIVMAEYYFNERPIDAASLGPAELLAVDRPFFGRHYIYGAAQAGFFDTFTFNASVLANLETGALIAALQASKAVFDGTIVSGSVRALYGDVNSMPGAAGLRLAYGITLETRF